MQCLEDLLRRRSHIREARLALAPVLYENGDYAGAVPLLRETIETVTGLEWRVRQQLAAGLSMSGAHGQAIEVLREAAHLEPEEGQLLIALSWTLSTCPDASQGRGWAMMALSMPSMSGRARTTRCHQAAFRLFLSSTPSGP